MILMLRLLGKGDRIYIKAESEEFGHIARTYKEGHGKCKVTSCSRSQPREEDVCHSWKNLQTVTNLSDKRIVFYPETARRNRK